ncbi:hypothetical protein ALO94_200995 [Pseudomonas syringae pv. spinaceae]|uniref:Tartrate dehydrogenase n=1 Tax=Pseudomonas syringae pv. spinaceae TaxID=264459 RepID=A0A0Q0ACC9_PSESX|nr:hypothetical protein ALO94_200995 [Pseudomonas syringae pv. spinaceae]
MDLVALVGVDRHFARLQALEAIASVGHHQQQAVRTIAADKGGNAFGARERVAGKTVGFEVFHVVLDLPSGQAHLQRLHLAAGLGEHHRAAHQYAIE